MKYVISLLCIHLSAIALSQDLLYVGNGLIVIDSASLEAKRTGKFNSGDQVALIERTKDKITILDHQNKLQGSWYQVKSTATTEVLTGYVFSGYLTFQKPDKSRRTHLNGYDLLITESSQSEFDSSDVAVATAVLLNEEQSV